MYTIITVNKNDDYYYDYDYDYDEVNSGGHKLGYSSDWYAIMFVTTEWTDNINIMIVHS